MRDDLVVEAVAAALCTRGQPRWCSAPCRPRQLVALPEGPPAVAAAFLATLQARARGQPALRRPRRAAACDRCLDPASTTVRLHSTIGYLLPVGDELCYAQDRMAAAYLQTVDQVGETTAQASELLPLSAPEAPYRSLRSTRSFRTQLSRVSSFTPSYRAPTAMLRCSSSTRAAASFAELAQVAASSQLRQGAPCPGVVLVPGSFRPPLTGLSLDEGRPLRQDRLQVAPCEETRSWAVNILGPILTSTDILNSGLGGVGRLGKPTKVECYNGQQHRWENKDALVAGVKGRRRKC